MRLKKRMLQGHCDMASGTYSLWRTRYPGLAGVSKTLGDPDPQAVLEDIELLDRTGKHSLAAAARVMYASQARDLDGMNSLKNGNAGNLLRSEPVFHYILVWSLYCAGGIYAAAGEVNNFMAAGHRALFEPWMKNMQVLKVFAEYMSGRKPHVAYSGSAAVPLLKGQTLPVIQAAVNDAEPAYFIVDTGAPSTLLSRSYARNTGIDFDRTIYREGRDGAGNTLRLHPGVLDRLYLGEVSCSFYPVLVTDLSEGLKVAGILSPLDLFRECFVEMNFRDNQLLIHSLLTGRKGQREQEESFRILPIRWNGESPLVRGFVNSQEGMFLLDTGAGANLLCRDFAGSLKMNPDGKARFETPTAAGQASIQEGGHGWFSVGEEPPAETDFLIKSCVTDPDDLFPDMMDGYIGMPWFRGRRLFFSPYGKDVAVTASQSSSSEEGPFSRHTLP